MVSKDNVIEVNSICICGNGDTKNQIKSYFENKCPICGKEGVLKVDSVSNIEINSDVGSADEDNDKSDNGRKVVATCGCGEFCGQDGYDIHGSTRGCLTAVNPNELEDDGDEEASSTEEGETSYMSGWEGLCDLLKPLDGQAMMVQRGDYVIIKKIEMPQIAKLWAYEGINVVDDSVSITDYTPEIYNTFVILWGESFENELEFVLDKHKALFGERKVVLEAKKVQPVSTDSDSKDSTDKKDDKDKDNNSSGGVFDWLFGTDGAKEEAEKSLKDEKTAEKTKKDSDSDTGESSDDKDAPETEEVPITTREEAIQFGLTEVGKAKREDGHTIELKVIGNIRFEMGEWCHVKLPSFNEDSYMFISKCGFVSGAEEEYINSLTLVDYPPSLGKPSKNKKEEDTDDGSDDDSDSTDDSTNTDGTDTGDGTGDGSDSSSTDTSN